MRSLYDFSMADKPFPLSSPLEAPATALKQPEKLYRVCGTNQDSYCVCERERERGGEKAEVGRGRESRGWEREREQREGGRE